MNPIIITGSGGILGSSLIREFTKKNVNVIAITSQVEKLRGIYRKHDNVKVIGSWNDIKNVFNPIVINCAFPRTNESKVLAQTFDYTQNLVDGTANLEPEFFINISSQSVYSQNGPEIPSEEAVVSPTTVYGLTKYGIEKIVELKTKKLNIKSINIRLGSLVDETFDQRMINRFYDMILEEKKITYDLGDPKVSYLHVKDAAAGIAKLVYSIVNKKPKKTVYNLGNNDWVSIWRLIEICSDISRELQMPPLVATSTKKYSDYNNVVNSNCFYEEFEWEPKCNMENIVRDIFIKKEKERNKFNEYTSGRPYFADE